MATHRLLLKDIINQTLRMAGDYFGTGYIDGKTWTRSQTIVAINQALLEWCRVTGFLRKEDTVALTEGTKIYDFPDDCLQPLNIAFYDGNSRVWIGEPVSLVDHDIAGQFVSGSSVPIKFFLEFLPFYQFGWQPNVGDDYTAYLTFTRSHTYLSDEATYPETAIPSWFHSMIKFGGAAILLKTSRDQFRQAKAKYCGTRWKGICTKMRSIKAERGPDRGMYAL